MSGNRFFGSTPYINLTAMLQDDRPARRREALMYLLVELPKLMQEPNSHPMLQVILTPLLAKTDIVTNTLMQERHPSFGNLHIYLTYVLVHLKPSEEKVKLLIKLLETYRSDKRYHDFLVKVFVESSTTCPGFENILRNDHVLLESFPKDIYEKVIAGVKDKNILLAKVLEEKMSYLTFKPSMPKTFSGELRQHYGLTSNDAKEQDLIECARFLSDQTKVMAQLKKLEARLQALAQHRIDSQTKLFHGYQNGKDFKHEKLLSHYLYSWAEKNGFPGVAILRDELQSEEFYAAIIDGLLLKDAHFRASDHGEWAHFIQWFILTEGNVDDKFLTSQPAELLAWIGLNSVTNPKLWNSTFEVPPEMISVNSNCFDARGVISLQKLLMSDIAAQELPVLHQLIKSRVMKGHVHRDKGRYQVISFKNNMKN